LTITPSDLARLKASLGDAFDAWAASVAPPVNSPALHGVDTSRWTQTFNDTWTSGIDWNVWDSVLPNSDHALSGSSEFANGEASWYVNHLGPLPIAPWTTGPAGLVVTADHLPTHLIPTIGYDQPGARNLGSYRYSSGVLHSKPGFSQTYGYFEIVCALPPGRGLWPGFWMLAMSGEWPPEIDIFEGLMHQTNRLWVTQHAPPGDTRAGIEVWASDPAADFTHKHRLGLLWEPDKLTFFLDGVPAGGGVIPNEIHEPMHLVIDLAVGGPASWPGAPDATTVFPARMVVERVSAWSLPT
jgi:beta-glucanase (GH16 family)